MTRETLCCTSPLPAKAAFPLDLPSRPKKADIPYLSGSVDSASSEDSDDDSTTSSGFLSKTAPTQSRLRTKQTRSIQSIPLQQRSRRISPLKLERMVESIQEKQKITALSPYITNAVQTGAAPPRPQIQSHIEAPQTHPKLHASDSTSSTRSSGSERSALLMVESDTSAEMMAPHSVIRGFSPNQVSSSYRSKTHLAPIPAPTKSLTHSKTVKPNFTLGGSSGEDESSFEEHIPAHLKPSSLSVGLKRPAASKKTSFREELHRKSYEDEEVFVDSDEEDSSAIDDDTEDDDENWEEASENEEAHADANPSFPRVDSKPNLVSRRSILTTQLSEGGREAGFLEAAEAQNPPGLRKAKTQVGLDNKEHEKIILGPHVKRSKPVSVASSNSTSTPIAFSPRTTRRHMLANEMTESLRKAVLFERQQKKATASAVLKRRHTTMDLANLREYPEGEEGGKENNSWNDYSSGVADYHQAGW